MDLTKGAACSLAITLALCGCGGYPESYAPPEQRPPFDDAARWERIIRMTDADAREHFVADIFDPLAANWRWTGGRPTVWLKPPRREGLKYRMEFVIPEQVLRSTGPVSVAFLVDGRVLDRKEYTAAGSYEFEKDVPPAWIAPNVQQSFGAEINKVYKADGRTFGFLLIGIGLKRS